MREQKVGSGITRHLRQSWEPQESADFERFLAEHHYIDPKKDFVGWIDQREKKIAKALKHFKLPEPNRCVVSEVSNPRSWRYDDNWEALGNHQRTEWYLQNFPYQTSFWYYGRILFFIHQCRLDIQSADWMGLAGHSLELGNVDREMHLKFVGQKRLRDFERYEALHEARTIKGNSTRKRKAADWQERARRLVDGNPDTDWGNISKIARDVTKAWPGSSKPPGKTQLKAFLTQLSERHVPADL